MRFKLLFIIGIGILLVSFIAYIVWGNIKYANQPTEYTPPEQENTNKINEQNKNQNNTKKIDTKQTSEIGYAAGERNSPFLPGFPIDKPFN